MSFAEKSVPNNLSTSNKKNIEVLKKDINKLSYEECMSELETILNNVQDENISLDKIQVNYIKGHLLLKHCQELLYCFEQEINELSPELLELD